MDLAASATSAGLHAEGVTRSFGNLRALDGVSFQVDPGEVVVLLGPNGAGKTTIIRILATTLLPDAGQAWVGGFDVLASPKDARARLGLMLAEERSFFWRLSGQANLEFFARLRGMRLRAARQEALRLLGAVGLADVGGRRVDRMSSGMRARLGLARALIGSPPVLLLDEPTRSIDAVAAIELRGLVTELASMTGTAVLYTTHDLHEAAAIASRTLVLARGQVVERLPGGLRAHELERALMTAVRPPETAAQPPVGA